MSKPQTIPPQSPEAAYSEAQGEMFQILAPDGTVTRPDALPDLPTRLHLYRQMRRVRHFDERAWVLYRTGRMGVFPPYGGMEASQVGTAAALTHDDWLFPTYRDSMALVTHGVPPEGVLSLLRGDWHCGYDPNTYRAAPQCTPLATNTLHAVGFAHAAKVKGEDAAALALLGDGATSEGDTHEALNFAGVWRAPVVFLVQNNGYAISVPLAKQTAAPGLAYKGVGYGVRSMIVDGNDAAAVFAAVRAALADAAAGRGPTLIEAITYRIEAHTNADDATRYRASDEVQEWLAKDPIERLETFLRSRGLLDDDRAGAVRAEAEDFAAQVRARLNADPELDPAGLFEHVYAAPTASLREQRRFLLDEISEHEGDR